MKRLILLILLPALCWAAPPTFVNNAKGSATTTGTTITATATLTTGNGLVALCISAAASGTITASGAGSTWTNVFTTPPTQTGEGNAQISYVKSIVTGGSQTITCTYSVSSAFRSIWIYQYSGQDTTTFLDSANTGGSLGSAGAVPAVTLTTSANSVMIGAASCGTSCAGALTSCTPANCTNGLSDGNGDYASDQASSAGGSTKVELSTSSQAVLMVAASFIAAGSGGGPVNMPPAVY